MDLDDLKQRWAEQDRKLDASLRLNNRLLQASALSRAETPLRRLSLLLWAELVLDLILVLWLGSFLAEHVSEARFLIPAAVLHLFVIALGGAGVYQLVAIRALDHGKPIVEIQKSLEALRIQRIRATMLVLLAAPLLWIPLLIVTLKGWLGIDAYVVFDGGWLVANVLFGLAVIPLAVWLSRRYASRMERSPRVQRLLRDLAGHNLNAALGFLERLEEFEAEKRA